MLVFGKVGWKNLEPLEDFNKMIHDQFSLIPHAYYADETALGKYV